MFVYHEALSSFKKGARRSIHFSALGLCFTLIACHALAFGQAWQNITQPIGTVQINPPQTGAQINQYLMSLDPNITPATFPFDSGTQVTKIITTIPQYFVRTYNPETGSNALGSWILRSSEVRGLSPEQIRNIVALPAQPTMFTLVLVPEGITMYTGIAGPIAGWGQGGAVQTKLVGPPYVPKENYLNQQNIGNCLLCYRVMAPEGSANQVGAALDRYIPKAYSSLESLYNNLDLLYFGPTTSQFRQALKALSGEGVTGSQTVSFSNTATFIETIRQQSFLWLNGNPLTQATSSANQSDSKTNIGWANATSGASYLKGNNSAASLNLSAASLQAGFGRELNPEIMFGVALGVSSARYSVSDLATDASLVSINLALYGIAKKENFYAAGTLSYSRGDTSLNRSISVNELFNQQKASFNTDVYSARVELGYRAKFTNVNLTPFVAFQPAWLRQNSFDESLANSSAGLVNMGLHYQNQTTISLPASLGLQFETKTALDNGWILNPTIRIAWIHDFQPDRSITASLNLLPSQSFSTYGASAPSNMAQTIFGLTATKNDVISGFLMIGADLSDRGQSLTAKAGLNILF